MPSRANGQGAIEKRIRKGVKRYIAKVSVDSYYDKSGKKQVKYKSIGTFDTKTQAELRLAEYFANPYDLQKLGGKMTVGELYEEWKAETFCERSKSDIRNKRLAFEYTRELHRVPLSKLTKDMVEEGVKGAYRVTEKGRTEASFCMQEKIKSFYNCMLDFAVGKGYIPKNVAREFDVNGVIKEVDERTVHKQPIEKRFLELMWKHKDAENMDMVIFSVYTGFRVSAFTNIKVSDVKLDTNIIEGGCKTDAGKLRHIPIHRDIRELVCKRYEEAKEKGSAYLFSDAKGLSYTYDVYKTIFCKAMKVIGAENEGYTPHCARVTFYNALQSAGVQDAYIKVLMGHSLKDDVGFEYYLDKSDKKLTEVFSEANIFVGMKKTCEVREKSIYYPEGSSAVFKNRHNVKKSPENVSGRIEHSRLTRVQTRRVGV